MARKLTAKQQRFVDEYLVDLNATQAAIRAKYSEKTAQVIGAENLKKPMIAAEIQARRVAVSQKLEITQEWVLQKLAAIADADATDYVTVKTTQEEKLGIHPITGAVTMLPTDQYVEIMDTEKLSTIKRAAIASIKQGKNGIEVRLHDKVRALEMLGRHLGLFENNAPPPTAENNLFAAIMESAQEDTEINDIQEIEQEAAIGTDVVESSSIKTL